MTYEAARVTRRPKEAGADPGIKEGWFFWKSVRGARRKILGDHAHFCQTTPILIKTRLRELN